MKDSIILIIIIGALLLAVVEPIVSALSKPEPGGVEASYLD